MPPYEMPLANTKGRLPRMSLPGEHEGDRVSGGAGGGSLISVDAPYGALAMIADRCVWLPNSELAPAGLTQSIVLSLLQ